MERSLGGCPGQGQRHRRPGRGPEGAGSDPGGWNLHLPGRADLRSIPTTSWQPDAARTLREYPAMPAHSEQYDNSAIYGPVLPGERGFPIFSNEVQDTLLGLVGNGTAAAAPDQFDGAYAGTSMTFVPRMLQHMVVDGMSIDDTMARAQTEIAAISAKSV